MKKLIKPWLANKYKFGLWILFSCMPVPVRAQDIASLKKSLVLAKNDSSKCRLLYDLGKIFERTYPDSSFYYINQSLQLSKRINNPKGIARAMFGIGYMNTYYIKDETKAMEWLNKSISVAKKVNDYHSLARSYQILSVISSHQGVGSPSELFYKALDYAKKDGDWRVLNDNYSIMSNYFIEKQNYNEAAKFTKLAMEVSQKYDIDEWVNHGLDYCDILTRQGKKATALELAQKMKTFIPKLKKKEGEFIYLNNVGRLETILKNYSEAERLFLKSLEQEKANIKVDTFHLYFIFQNLEALYLEQGAYKKAYQVSKNLMGVILWLNEKRQTQDSKVQMTKLKANLDIEKKEVEITLLETKQKQQRLFLTATVIVALLLIAFMFFLQINRRKVQFQKNALSELNATKDKLFAILSHDLRSPVASLKSYLMLINWGALSQKEFADATSRLNTQLGNLGNSLDNVLNWSISQMGGMKPKPVKLNVFEIIEETILMLQLTQEAKQITIKNYVSLIEEVGFDKNHFRIIIRNLLQNALKFTTSDGNVVFNLIKESTSVIITISDDGVGIANDKLDTLFELGKHDLNLGTAREPGTGLGLVLVKELTELNGGTISVKSQLGQGTTFSIRIPNT